MPIYEVLKIMIQHLKNKKLGMFKELPRKKDITDSDYEAITNKSYFLR
jgi:hypothetical protein